MGASSDSDLHAKPAGASRAWFFFGGALSILVGVIAIGAPLLFSQVLTQLLGAFCLVSGVVGLFLAVFGKDRSHRFSSGFSGVIRIAAGCALLFYTTSGMLMITLILAGVFLAEGMICVATALRMRKNPAWIWLLLNGVTALILGGMIYARWPLDAGWVIGLLYGIQSIFSGTTLVMLALAAGKRA